MRRVIASCLLVVVAACGSEPDVADTVPATAPPLTAPAPVTASPATTVGAPTSTSTDPPTQDPGENGPEPGALPSPVARAPADPSAPVAELVGGFNSAGYDLLRTLPLSDNVVFSPTSIGHALLMARAAADDPTGAAIDDGFDLPTDDSAHTAWNALDQQLAAANSDDVTITVADRIWPRVDLEPDQRWIDLLAAQHGADVETLDFDGDPDGSRQRINQWVSDRTAGRIPELLPEGFINPGSTVLVMTDAIYFAADWQNPFGKYGPVDGTFTTLDGSKLETEFMEELELGDRRGVGDGFAAAELPYRGNDFSMLVIVPEDGRFEEIRGELDHELLDEIDATFTAGPYRLLLPKWENSTSIDLMPWLAGLGAAPGRYPAITPDAFLGAAVHGADIAVDERGTVAAAATALAFDESGPPEPELTIAADKPFLYVIRHRATGLVLFLGQVVQPTP